MKRLTLITISTASLLIGVMANAGVNFGFNFGFPAPCRPVYVVQEPCYVVRPRPVYAVPVRRCKSVRRAHRVHCHAPRPRFGFNFGFGL